MRMSMVLGEWDLANALKNAATLTQTIGGLILGLLGVIAILVAVVHTFGKLTSDQSNKKWGRIIGTFIIGGLMLAGGLTLFVNVAQGVQGTVDQLGNGVIMPFLR